MSLVSIPYIVYTGLSEYVTWIPLSIYYRIVDFKMCAYMYIHQIIHRWYSSMHHSISEIWWWTIDEYLYLVTDHTVVTISMLLHSTSCPVSSFYWLTVPHPWPLPLVKRDIKESSNYTPVLTQDTVQAVRRISHLVPSCVFTWGLLISSSFWNTALLP